jgi:hypothetical protein
MAQTMQKTDVTVEGGGSIFLFRPHTDAATDWIEEHVQPDAQWFGGGLVVEHRYARDLADSMLQDGLDVR